MKKFPAEAIMEVILPEGYAAEYLEEKGKKDKGKDMPPKPLRLTPALGRRPAAEQKVFRDKKRGPAGFGWFAVLNTGKKQIHFFYIPGE
jgi:hypothetical protein